MECYQMQVRTYFVATAFVWEMSYLSFHFTVWYLQGLIWFDDISFTKITKLRYRLHVDKSINMFLIVLTATWYKFDTYIDLPIAICLSLYFFLNITLGLTCGHIESWYAAFTLTKANIVFDLLNYSKAGLQLNKYLSLLICYNKFSKWFYIAALKVLPKCCSYFDNLWRHLAK